jgi:hypothetical protein
MEKFNKQSKKNKSKKIRKFYCTLCERLVVKHNHIKVRKNYPFGRNSKPQITREHRCDGGCLVEVKRKKR